MKMRRVLPYLVAIAGAMFAGAHPAFATVVYDATGATDGFSISSDPTKPTLDDLTVAQGGVLSSVSFVVTPTAEPGTVNPINYNVALYLYLDADTHDGAPRPNDPSIGLFGPDTRLYREIRLQQTIAPDAGPTLMTFSGLAGQNIVIPNGARLWGGVAFFNLNDEGFPYNHFGVGHAAYGPPSVGSSDSDVYTYIGFLDSYLPLALGSGDPGDNTETLGMRISVVPEPASLALLASGAVLILRRRR
jgi:hypothetical protein